MRTDTVFVAVGSVAVVILYLFALRRKYALTRPAVGSSSLRAGRARANALAGAVPFGGRRPGDPTHRRYTQSTAAPPYSWGNDDELYKALEEWTREWEESK